MGAWLVSVVIVRLTTRFILRFYYLHIDVERDAIVSFNGGYDYEIVIRCYVWRSTFWKLKVS